MKHQSISVIAVTGLCLLAGCWGAGGSGTGEKVYTVKGKVVAIDADKKSVRVDHQEIPGYMKAMTMKNFDVAEARLLEGLAIGDEIEGRIRAESGKNIFFELKKAGAASEADEIRESLAKLSDADRALAEAQKFCPTGEPLGSMGVPPKIMVKGQPVFLCCKGCAKDALADPDGTLAKIAEFKKKAK